MMPPAGSLERTQVLKIPFETTQVLPGIAKVAL